jgi:hypothetical protein
MTDRKAASRTRKHGGGRGAISGIAERDKGTGLSRSGQGRFETVMKAAKRSGLMNEKSSRIAGRVSPALVEQAKLRTGIETDTDLIAFALANIALEDNFAEAFKDVRGKADAGLRLGF